MIKVNICRNVYHCSRISNYCYHFIEMLSFEVMLCKDSVHFPLPSLGLKPRYVFLGGHTGISPCPYHIIWHICPSWVIATSCCSLIKLSDIHVKCHSVVFPFIQLWCTTFHGHVKCSIAYSAVWFSVLWSLGTLFATRHTHSKNGHSGCQNWSS